MYSSSPPSPTSMVNAANKAKLTHKISMAQAATNRQTELDSDLSRLELEKAGLIKELEAAERVRDIGKYQGERARVEQKTYHQSEIAEEKRKTTLDVGIEAKKLDDAKTFQSELSDAQERRNQVVQKRLAAIEIELKTARQRKLNSFEDRTDELDEAADIAKLVEQKKAENEGKQVDKRRKQRQHRNDHLATLMLGHPLDITPKPPTPVPSVASTNSKVGVPTAKAPSTNTEPEHIEIDESTQTLLTEIADIIPLFKKGMDAIMTTLTHFYKQLDHSQAPVLQQLSKLSQKLEQKEIVNTQANSQLARQLEAQRQQQKTNVTIIQTAINRNSKKLTDAIDTVHTVTKDILKEREIPLKATVKKDVEKQLAEDAGKALTNDITPSLDVELIKTLHTMTSRIDELITQLTKVKAKEHAVRSRTEKLYQDGLKKKPRK